jgi:hypothetical protein
MTNLLAAVRADGGLDLVREALALVLQAFDRRQGHSADRR